MMEIRPMCASVAALMLMATTDTPVPAPLPPPAPVRIEQGLVQGVALDGGVAVYRGVPFAAPPIGDLRWKPPVRPLSWDGVRRADAFGPDCWPGARVGGGGSPAGVSEDCLTLNIWTPTGKAAKPRPVMLWIYGSAFQGGTALQPRYDGAALARRGVILITVNYRAGPLGFLTHPALTAESAHKSSGNYGVLDAIAALRWVQDNARAFGGDPANVTIFGQSSGSETVNILTATPLARGLFARAINESGAAFGLHESRTLAVSEAKGLDYAAKLSATTATDLRALPAQALYYDGMQRFEPVVDGWMLPHDVRDIYSAGRQNHVSMLIGSNADEGQLNPKLTAAAYQDFLTATFGPGHAEVTAAFPGDTDAQAQASQKRLMTALHGDYNMATLTALASKTSRAPLYRYRFNHVPGALPDGSGPKGAFHGAEIAYAFGTLDKEKRAITPADRALSRTLTGYWVNFARTGNPNGPGLPQWPTVKAAPGKVMTFDQRAAMAAAPANDHRALFDRQFYGVKP